MFFTQIWGFVIARALPEANQKKMDCFVPRNDELSFLAMTSPHSSQ